MAEANQVACPECGKQYRWRAELAGRKVKCKACDSVFRMPEELEAGGQRDNSLELASTPADRSGSKCPSCNAEVSPTAVICISCGFNLKKGTKLTTKVESGSEAKSDSPSNASAPPQQSILSQVDKKSAVADGVDQGVMDVDGRKQDLYIPLGLIGAGVVLSFLNWFLVLPAEGHVDILGTPIAPWTYRIGIILGNLFALLRQLPFLFVGILIVAKLFGTSFGNLFTALLKLVAVIVMAGSIGSTVDSLMDIMTGGLGGLAWMLTFSINFAVFFALVMWILELDPMETMVLWLVTYLVPVFAVGFLIIFIYSLF